MYKLIWNMPSVVHEFVRWITGYKLVEMKCENTDLLTPNRVSFYLIHYMWSHKLATRSCSIKGHRTHWFRLRVSKVYDIN